MRLIPRAKDLRRLWFEWPESLYGRFNFQRDEHIDALMGLLTGNRSPAVLLLGGEPGIGRSFLCDAAAQRARDYGHKVAVWHLDLDGFEPDTRNPLTQYLRHLIDQEERQLEAARNKAKGAVKSAAKTLSKLDLVGQASELAASLLSLLWQFEDPLKHFAELLSLPSSGNGAPPRDDPDTLHRFLAELTRDRKLLVHVRDGQQLTSNLRRWLIREAERAPERLLLVISCPLDQATERVAPEARSTPESFDVHPLESAELRILLGRRFEPNNFPDQFVTLLMRRSRGRQSAIANQLADLMEAELLLYTDETWHLPPTGFEDQRLVEAFSRSLFEEVDKPLFMLAEEEPELARVLREFLSLASLCGNYVPIAALLEHLQLDETTTEAVVEWVDDVLVGELSWLNDLGFHVAGLPGHNVYAFTHPLLPLVILDQELEVDREIRAVTLLRFLEQRVPVTKRGWARCFLSIAEHLGNREREPYERSLAWWIGLEAADSLQVEVRTAIEREEIEPELVWRVANNSEAWPAFRRLAVLEAYAQARVCQGEATLSVLPFNRLANFHLLRGDLLIIVGRYAEALVDAQNALKLVSGEPLGRCRALTLSGAALYNLGSFRAAKCDLEEAVTIDLGTEHPVTVSARGNLGVTLDALGDFSGAESLLGQNLKIRERVLGAEHLSTLKSRHDLAVVLAKQGKFLGARKLLEQVMASLERALGSEYPYTVMIGVNLSSIIRELGDLATARRLCEQNLNYGERVLGAEHRFTLLSKYSLALILHDLGDFAGAKEFYEQTLKIQERVLGKEHADTMRSSRGLARSLHDSGCLDAARKLLVQTLETQVRVLGREHHETLLSSSYLAETLRVLGKLEDARSLLEHTLQVQDRVLGAEHTDTTLSAWNLLQTIHQLSDHNAEVHLVEKLRWLLESDRESIPTLRQREIRQRLLDFLNTV